MKTDPIKTIIGIHCTDSAVPDEMADYYPVIDDSGEIIDVVGADESGYIVVDWDDITGNITPGGKMFFYCTE